MVMEEKKGGVMEMKTNGKRARGRPNLRWKDTVREDLKLGKIHREWARDMKTWKTLCETHICIQGEGGGRWEIHIKHIFSILIVFIVRQRFIDDCMFTYYQAGQEVAVHKGKTN